MTASALPPARTWLCSVVCLGVARDAARPPGRETSGGRPLDRYVAESVHGIPEAERVLLPTAEGALLCFPGEPERALLCALHLEGSFLRESAAAGEARPRIGIALGPVRVARGSGGTLDAVGEGIDEARRVMAFASGGQILACRAYRDVVSRLAGSYARMFEFVGPRTDGEAREHFLYELRPPEAQPPAFTSLLTSPGPAPGTAAPGPPPLPTTVVPGLAPAALDRARRELAAYLGPVAKVLVGRAARRAASERQLYEILADGIGDPGERARFLAAAPPRLP